MAVGTIGDERNAHVAGTEHLAREGGEALPHLKAEHH
ncbi:unannotated protein [freshwater metagenome]|uniref:Unannotated protein n=1 Tax=freshwater metagenome TaxID=449393 RepID=A0A6J7JRN4_9ZZZZ